MTIKFCCMLLMALTLNISDLSQTASFTAQGSPELNPIVRDLVEGNIKRGEIALGIVSAGLLLYAEAHPGVYATLLRVGMITGHGVATLHNSQQGYKIPLVIFPVLIIKF